MTQALAHVCVQAVPYLNPGMGVFDIEYRDLGRTISYGNQTVCIVAPLNTGCS